MTLPLNWRPTALEDLTRLGSRHDGGYVVPERAISETDLLLSLGISDDWTFEDDFCRRNPRVRVIGYDPTITGNFWLKRVVGHVAAAVFRVELRRFMRVFDWFRYKAFFDGSRNEHRSIRIGYDGVDSTSLSAVFRTVTERRVFLKVDIEGSEYRVLDQIAENANRLTGLAIEFHDVDLMHDRISEFLVQVREDLLLCHTHANNCAGVDSKGDPIAIELSFVSKALLKPGEKSEFAVLPSPVLDAPNDATKPEIYMTFAA